MSDGGHNALSGTLISGIYPLLLTYATEAVPEHSGPAAAVAATAAAVGFGVVPALLAVVISTAGPTRAMALLVLPLLGVLAIVLLARLGDVRAARRGRADRE